METRPPAPIDETITPIGDLTAAAEMNGQAAEQTTQAAGNDLKERAKDISHGAMDMGTKMLHGAADRLHQFPESPETKSRARVIAIGTAAAATGIGVILRRRQSKSGPEGLIEKAKDLIPSR